MTEPNTETAGPAVNTRRQRPPRLELKRAERRRRKAGTLNRMAQFKLDIFDEKQLDNANYVYRWVDDVGARLRQATKGDDYDFVMTDEIDDFDPDTTDSESSQRLRQISGVDKQGNPTYTYLLRKPREYFNEDMDENVQFRENVMEQRVYEGVETEVDEDDNSPEAVALREASATFYAAQGNNLGGPNGGRRRGPVIRKSSLKG